MKIEKYSSLWYLNKMWSCDVYLNVRIINWLGFIDMLRKLNWMQMFFFLFTCVIYMFGRWTKMIFFFNINRVSVNHYFSTSHSQLNRSSNFFTWINWISVIISHICVQTGKILQRVYRSINLCFFIKFFLFTKFHVRLIRFKTYLDISRFCHFSLSILYRRPSDDTIIIQTRTRVVQHKCLPHIACINPTPLLFKKL